MRHRSRAFAALTVAFSALAPGLAATPAEPGVTVTITVTSLRDTKGVVRACLTRDAAIFPNCKAEAASYQVVVPAAATVQLTFTDVVPGHYAISMLHDENNNGKADRALGMVPKEGFGFSRDAKVRMGPPKFEDAAFDVGNEPISQVIKMRYML